jgi:NAD(P)-dependent dehydrogenase (short-subunit alcohol dehydrogenase family)
VSASAQRADRRFGLDRQSLSWYTSVSQVRGRAHLLGAGQPHPKSLRQSGATTTHEGNEHERARSNRLGDGRQSRDRCRVRPRLPRRGAAKVYGAARDPASVSDADVAPVRMDVTNDTEVAAAAETCPDVTIVVNNAGIGFAVSALSTKVATKGRAMFDTNVFGILNVASAFAPIIEGNGGGALINVLSIASWRTSSTLALYSASKSAAWSLTNSLRLELEPRGIQVVGVHCGFVDTDLTAGMQMAKIGPADVALATIAGIVAGDREVLVDDISRQIRAELAQDLIVQYPELNAVTSPQP